MRGCKSEQSSEGLEEPGVIRKWLYSVDLNLD
jgi:hypothetical protein